MAPRKEQKVAKVTMVAKTNISLTPEGQFINRGERFELDESRGRSLVERGAAEFAGPAGASFPQITPKLDVRAKVRAIYGLAADASLTDLIAAITELEQIDDAKSNALVKFQAKVEEKVKADTREVDPATKLTDAQRAVSIEEPELYAAVRE